MGSLAVLLAAADTYVVVLALTDMMSGVGLGVESLQRGTPIISGFLLGYVAALPLAGRLVDLLDCARVLRGFLLIFVVGSVVTALAVELDVLVVGRFVQGVGGGGLVPATLALVAVLWPPERRGIPIGVVSGVQELGAVLGPVLGALILAVADWRAIFWFNAVVGTALLIAVGLLAPAGSRPGPARRWRRRLIPTLGAVIAGLGLLTLAAPEGLATDVTLGLPFVSFSGTSRVLTPIGAATATGLVVLLALTARRWRPVLAMADLPGAALAATVLGSIVLAFSTADPAREVLGAGAALALPVGAVALVLLVVRQRGATTSLVPAGMLTGRGAAALGVSLLVGVALVSVLVDVPLLARLTLMSSQTTAALVLVRFLVAVPVGAVLGGWALGRFGPGVVAGAGLLLAAVGQLVVSGWRGEALADAAYSTGVLAAVGIGLGLALAPVNAVALEAVPSAAHGVAGALVVLARTVGMVVGLALLTGIGLHRYYGAVAALPNQGDGRALLDAALIQVHTVFLGGALAAGLAAILAVALGWHRRAAHPVAREAAQHA